MTRIIIAAALAFAFASPAAAQSVGGTYAAQGTNFDGTPYQGEATITLLSETTCEIRWKTGETESSGICMRNDDSFAAGYDMGGKVGLIIYKMMPDGSLHGLWTIAGESGHGTEILTPIQ